jgi:RNA polymerase sigma-70 factor (TIGR02957 family)
MNHTTSFFNRLRPRLQSIAYRMLGTVAEAEDLVQDVWLRWHEADTAELENAEAWLVTVTTRLAIDRLRAAKVQRAHYTGFWLPEPQLTSDDGPASPEELLEQADDISMAFLALLERLAPEQRAAFLLREVFDADYGEVARALGKSEAACRQIVSRAKAQLKEGRVRQSVSPDTHYKLLSGFAEAARRGDFATLQALLAEDAELISDGGGKVPSFGKALAGAARIAQLYLAFWMHAGKSGHSLRMELVQLNGQWGLLRFVDGQLESAQSFESDGAHITRIHTQRNPDKLRRIAEAWAVTNAGGASS